MTTDRDTCDSAWLESLIDVDASNEESGKEGHPSCTDWLASLSSVTENREREPNQEATLVNVVPPEPLENDSDNDIATWLIDLGFDCESVKEVLKTCGGDADEALLKLRQQVGASTCIEKALPASKRPRTREIIEIDGFQCIRRGKELLLQPPDADVVGPTIGKFRPDGSYSFHGVDEWALELYNSKGLRADIPIGEEYDSDSASKALKIGEPWCWRSFASAAEVRNAHAELEALHEARALRAAAADTAASTKARSDHVCFLALRPEMARDGRPMCPPGCLLLFQRLEAAAARLYQWLDYGHELLFPGLGMAAVYDGGGANYAAHRDNEFDQGHWLNYRALTALTYVNPCGFEDASDGGMLRCYVGADAGDRSGTTAKQIQDITPRGGTAVLFPSRVLLHEVLPSHARRYALTLWLLSAPPNGEPGHKYT